MPTVVLNPGDSLTVPAGVTVLDSVECWAEGGDGGTGLTGGSSHSGAGGGSGEFARENNVAVTPGNTYTPPIGTGGTGTNTVFTGDSVTITAHAGGSASGTVPGAKGTGSANTVHHDGGTGGAGIVHTDPGGGGGAGGAGSGGTGGNGGNGAANGFGTAGAAGTPDGGAGGQGGNGAITGNPGSDGSAPGGGGGGGSGRTAGTAGGSGAAGQVIITYSVPVPAAASWSGSGDLTAGAVISGTISGAAAWSGTGAFTAGAGLAGGGIVNQWAGSYSQLAGFGTTLPALQSCVVGLNPDYQVAPGTGVPTAGNWLIAIAGWNQAGLPAATVGVFDDISSFWRTGDEDTSTWATSPASGSTRTAVRYTANLRTAPGWVYCAPSGQMAGLTVLVIEVHGLSDFDVVTAIDTASADGATSLALAAGAPPAAAMIIAAVTGDDNTAGQAFAPAGWLPLATVTTTDGAGHACDVTLTSAVLPSTTGSVSVSGSASSSTDLSGVLIGIRANAPSPIPAGANPAWAGRMILEMADGAGYQTPPDEMTWTVLSDNAWTSTAQGWKRFWSWNDSTGVPYALGQLQSSSGSIQLDNWDGNMSPVSAAGASPWSFTCSGTPADGTYFTVTAAQAAGITAGDPFTDVSNPGVLFKVTGTGAPTGGLVNVSITPAATTVMASPDVVTRLSPTTGNPVRLRMALGTLAGGTVVNRWYTWARNALAWPERRNKALRGFVPVTTADLWSVVAGSCPTPYRGEVEQDNPSDWWPMDDQPLAGGVQPAFLRNAAAGSSVPLTIYPAPGGVTGGDAYSTSGTDLTSGSGGASGTPPPSVAIYAAGQQQGWGYGDPQSSPQSAATGNPVTSSPGSAAWQQSGLQGNTGSNGWFLAATSASFPPLADGASFGLWFSPGFFGSSAGFKINTNVYNIAGQPVTTLTLAELATGSAPVAILQLDGSGHLILKTYDGGTATSHAIYSASDLRAAAWQHVMLTTDGDTWTVYLNGGLTATVSGTGAGMTSAWTWLVIGADLGSSGGSSLSAATHMSNTAWSHAEVYPSVLPRWRVLAHYAAMITGFGVLPAPQQLALSTVISETGAGSWTPDGSVFDGSYGSGGVGSPFTISAVTAARAGSYTSGPSARAVTAALGVDNGGTVTGAAVWASWTSLCPSTLVYTSAAAGAETNAATALGSGDSFTSGYGSGASGHGVSQVSGGTGASPPAAPSSLGDTVAQRIERCFGYGAVTAPSRAVDSTAAELVQAALDVGGQQLGANVQNIVNSDNGLLFTDNNNTICYRSRPHLNADTVTWHIGMDVIAGMIPFDQTIEWSSDPQRVWDAITVTPYSPDGASLASLTPADADAANAAQRQFGPRPYPVISYLQDPVAQQSQADFLLQQFGQLRRRASVIAVDAATHPEAWEMVLGMNVGDVAQIYDAPFGQPATTGNYRVSHIDRTVAFGANGSQVAGRMVLVLDPLVVYWE